MTKSAEIDLNKKLALERSYMLRLRKLFKFIIEDSWMAFFDPNAYEKDLATITSDHYINVFSVFGNDYRKKHDIDMPSIQALMLESTAYSKFAERSATQAGIITNTNRKQLAKAKSKVNENFDKWKADGAISSKAGMIVSVYSRMMYGRLDAITCYETQWCAEYSKALEVSYLIGQDGVAAKARKGSWKRWDAMGDDIMRPWHAAADSQVVKSNDLFTVNGEKLDYPGDTSHGATVSNIINCRCSATYDLDPNKLMLADQDDLIEAAPTKLATADQVQKVGDRINKSLDKAIADGAKEIEEELTALLNEYNELRDKFDAGEKIFHAQFKSIGLRLREIRKRQGITKPTKPVRPKPIAVKPKPVRRSKPKPAPEPRRPVKTDVGGDIGFKYNLDDALDTAESEMKAIFGDDVFDRKYDIYGYRDLRESIKSEIKRLNKGNSYQLTKPKNYKPNVAGGKQQIHTSGWKKSAKAVDDVTKEFFDDVLGAGNLFDDDRIFEINWGVATPTQRAFASEARNQIMLDSGTEKRTVAHEFGHHIEFRNSRVLDRVTRWRRRRIQAAKDRGERMLSPNGEDQWRDEFFSSYVGRTYRFQSTEVVSMGVDALFDLNKFKAMMRKDPEHLKLIWSILRGY